MSYVLAFLGFAALIILHEAGHFAAAKAVGMRVERFSLFFGPMLVKTRRGETEYGIGPIPLGGYVKITGMNPREEMPDEVRPRAYYNQPVWKRVVVILAGPAVNLVLAIAILFAIYATHGYYATNQRVSAIEAGTPAAKVLKAGDQLISVDGVGGSPERLRSQLATHHCAGTQTGGCLSATPAVLVVDRAGRRITLGVRPRYNATDGRAEVGFVFGERHVDVSAGRAASLGISDLWKQTTGTVSRVAKLFESQDRAQLHGTVYGFKVTQQSFARSTPTALYVLGIISWSLAIINLFPFLPLDGGHVFWALAEKVRGRRISFQTMERAGVVGFVLILLLFVIGLSNDISGLTGRGFATP
jgi:regulator of sigma E protease